MLESQRTNDVRVYDLREGYAASILNPNPSYGTRATVVWHHPVLSVNT
jgi:hypothetical protein